MNPNLQRGILLYQQSRHEMAEAELRQALASEPQEAYAHGMLALCLVEREQFKEATAEAEQAIHLQPDLAFTHYVHARVFCARNRFPEARAAIEEAIRLDSAEAEYFALLATIHLQQRRWKDMLSAAEQGLQFDSEHIGCTNLRAMALVKLGRKAEAGATIDAALAKNPESAPTHANQGWTLLERGEPKKALEHFREALRLDPDNDWARQGIVEALKARNIIYAVMLKYFLWISRFGRRGQWAIILGAFLGDRVLSGLAVSYPVLAPWVLPLQILYVVFALMTWMAYPFFNLLLRVNRFGRLVLTRDQIVASNWFGLCLLCALVALGGCVVFGFQTLWLIGAIIFGFLLLPVSTVFGCPRGWQRNAMAGLTLCLFLLGAAMLGTVAVEAAHAVPGRGTAAASPAKTLFQVFIIGTVASTWLSNILRSRRQLR